MAEVKDYIYFGTLDAAPDDVLKRWADETEAPNKGMIWGNALFVYCMTWRIKPP